MSGHFGIGITLKRILKKFYWLEIKREVLAYCKSCHTCQLVRKSKKVVPKAYPPHPFHPRRGKTFFRKCNAAVILNFPVPKNGKEVMQFLGIAGYYQKFVANFSELVEPLTNLLKENVHFCWSLSCEDAFNKIKAVLTIQTVLKSSDFSKPFQLAVDASDVGIDGLLLQVDENSIAHLVAYYSKKLDIHQSRYSTIGKETLELIISVFESF